MDATHPSSLLHEAAGPEQWRAALLTPCAGHSEAVRAIYICMYVSYATSMYILHRHTIKQAMSLSRDPHGYSYGDPYIYIYVYMRHDMQLLVVLEATSLTNSYQLPSWTLWPQWNLAPVQATRPKKSVHSRFSWRWEVVSSRCRSWYWVCSDIPITLLIIRVISPHWLLKSLWNPHKK